MSVITSFPPIVDSRCQILILGSMPSIRSLQAQEYYAHPQNQFWKIMAVLLGHALPLTYAQKKRMLLKSRIALWDVISSCKREGSLDSRIRQVKFNDFAALFKKYKSIRAVFCNGNTAFKLFQKASHRCDLPVFPVPSTSPAYTKSLAWKTGRWKNILPIIDDRQRLFDKSSKV
ncbi:MAG TPA: DNA-deoxyinosine glycosylase [Candidatus Omnitrophota bacterium]|nr:DNA-deoxyinosine glycosylase [Candidatus Omnitrophota bacterium]